MSFKKDIDSVMKNIQVDDDLKNEILNDTVRSNLHRRKFRTIRRKAVVVAMASVLCLGTIAVAGEEISGLWDKALAKMFGVSEEIQQKMVDQGYVDIADEDKEIASDTQAGYTVSVKQMISDKNALYIYLNIKSEEGKEIPEEIGFIEVDVAVEGDHILRASRESVAIDRQNMISTESVGEEYENADNEVGYLIRCSREMGTDLKGKDISVRLKYMTRVTGVDDAEWNLKWKAESSAEMKKVILNNSWESEYEHEGKTKSFVFDLKSFEISPISFRLKFDCDTEAWNEYSWYDDGEIPIKIAMKDGTCYSRPDVGENEIYLWTSGTASWEEEIKNLEYIIDVEKIDYVEIGGKRYDIN